MKISAADALLFAEELETGTGRMVALAERNPGLVSLSRSAAADLCGGSAVCFRSLHLKPGSMVRSEGPVSTTLSPLYALRHASEAPTLTTSEGFVDLEPVLLRYDLPIDRMLVYVPAAIQAIRGQRASALARTKLKTRLGGRMSALGVMEAVESLNEQEAYADVSGFEPEKLPLGNTTNTWFAMDWLMGHFSNGEEALDYMHRVSSSRYFPRAAYVDKFQQMIDLFEVFFREPTCAYRGKRPRLGRWS
jgi:hypothetical protein